LCWVRVKWYHIISLTGASPPFSVCLLFFYKFF
jgi:hypothetical protein